MKKLLLAVVAIGTFTALGGCATSGNNTAASNEPKIDDKSYNTGSRIGRSERPPAPAPAEASKPTPAPAGAGN